MAKKREKKQNVTDLDQLKKLMILQLYYVNDVPAELIGKAVNMNANSIRNMFPKKDINGRTKPSKVDKIS